jgi:hypothetical protein
LTPFPAVKANPEKKGGYSGANIQLRKLKKKNSAFELRGKLFMAERDTEKEKFRLFFGQRKQKLNAPFRVVFH